MTMSAMGCDQGLDYHSQELPPQPSPLIPFFKKGSTVNLACSESALKQQHEARTSTLFLRLFHKVSHDQRFIGDQVSVKKKEMNKVNFDCDP